MYRIEFGGLESGLHHFSFDLEDAFFAIFENSDILHGKLKAEVDFEKNTSLLALTIRIAGFVNVVCDRCLDEFDMKTEYEGRLFFRFGDGMYEEQSDNVFLIPRTESMLDMSQHFYEGIMLSMPIRKVHPENDNGESTCNREMIDKIRDYSREKEAEEDNFDIRWNELKKIKNGTS